MRIVIDMQGAQTESRFRGIGRYCLSFAQAVARNRGSHEVVLALNAGLPESIEPIRAAFEGVLAQSDIRVWHAPGPLAEHDAANDARRETAELVREAFIANLEPDLIHVGSLFEGYLDGAVTSVGRLDRKTPVSVTLYDLIPLLNPQHYLDPNPRYKRYYLRKIGFLEQAALCVAISEFTLREGVQYLRQSAGQRFVNVSTAIDSCFAPLSIGAEEQAALRAKFGIDGEFVMYAGGIDERKNIARLIQAFAALPRSLVDRHRLLLAGRMPEPSVAEFRRIAQHAGLDPNRLCFTGHVSDDELVRLYNLCALFVLPSWHEGFGLPALEAMACGAPTIGAKGTSLDEVIGMESALFDPFDVAAISARIAQALKDDALRASLRKNGLEQAEKFSWDIAAQRALAAWSELSERCAEGRRAAPLPTSHKPKLAFVSPLPPERTGIADYSAQLLPALANWYEIDVIVVQQRIEDPWIEQHCTMRNTAWLREHAHDYERVLYQMGNSAFHAHMLPLMREIPGVVVLHDFYLSALLAWLQYHEGIAGAWTNALYEAHGYQALAERFRDPASAERDYPVNLEVLQRARGVIVHSNHARELVRQWCGEMFFERTEVVPHLRPQSELIDRGSARASLEIGEDDFLVCSFGFLGGGKLNHRLLDAWAASALSRDASCRLVFVGETHDSAYQERLLAQIKRAGLSKQVRITGYAPPELFRRYLSAADLAVQLRADSRGETSGAALGAMNHGIALIVNAIGSMAELPRDAALMLPEEFDDAQLADAIEQLWRSPQRRRELGEHARDFVMRHHATHECAHRYATAIERFHGTSNSILPDLVQAIAAQDALRPQPNELVRLARTLGADFPLPEPARRLWLDISVICREDIRTGIQRVVRALLLALLKAPPAGFRVEPVYLCEMQGYWAYRGARRYTCGLLGCPPHTLADEFVEPGCGDILIALDLSHDMMVRAEQAGTFAQWRNRGVAVYAVVFDLLPVLMPEVFPPGTDLAHANWLRAISNFDGALCISEAVADELAVWRLEQGIDATNLRQYQIEWFHLGSDFDQSAPTSGLPSDHLDTLAAIRARISFLMVGTLEPRKGYLDVLEVFDRLWSAGSDINLVIVGKEGWKALPDEARRTIPETVNRLRRHAENGRRLFWLESVSDEYLEKIYAASDCLIAASYGEGFGLPLIEAARHGIALIARDIPVFREVAGDHAFYFKSSEPADFALAIETWIGCYARNEHPRTEHMNHCGWDESARQMLKNIVNVKL